MNLLITRTPFRISFFGGGTDYPGWYRKEGGAVLSTSIDKYCYISCRYLPPFFPNTYRVVWTHIESVSSIGEILHPAVREALYMMGFEGDRGLEIHHQGDLPARSGMGSSSSFANGLLLALSALRGKPLDQHSLFKQSIHLEQERLRENVGSQDQVATALGGFNLIRFGTSGAITVDPLKIDAHRVAMLESHLMLFYTGSQRIASQIASEVVANLSDRSAELKRMHSLVDESVAVLLGSGPILDFGRMLDETWRLKRSVASSVSNSLIDEIYEIGRRNGAIGGKLLGAGGTGFMLFFAPPKHHANIRAALPHLMHVPFKFERGGATIIHGFESVEHSQIARKGEDITQKFAVVDLPP